MDYVTAMKPFRALFNAGAEKREARKHTARTSKNPQSGKDIKVATATVPAFKAGKAFKDAVNVKSAK
ncbi:MAG: HU family DNA-binding protein [Acidaminococcaceae bacterium]|nr:HU family DNA-binding protein [Acidaminococcaceae bacterium]